MTLEVFYSYSHKDEDLRAELEKHLSLLRRSGHIVDWNDRRIGAGDEWRGQIDAHMRSASIILLLISPDFLASDYCYDVEMKLALARHDNHDAIVIPVILRPVDWSEAPFAGLQALPRDAKPVTTWANRDEAFADVARSIREVVSRFSGPQPATPEPAPLVDRYVPKPRVLDAAIPSHIVKDRATEVLVLIRLPESAGLKGLLLTDDEAEARPDDVRSNPFGMTFPIGPLGRPESLKTTVRLTSLDFYPPEQAKNVFVPPDADSDICPFALTPIKTGRLRVLVELQWEDALRGSRRLLTECVADAASAPANPPMNVLQFPLGGPPSLETREAAMAPPAAPAPPPPARMVDARPQLVSPPAPPLPQPAAPQPAPSPLYKYKYILAASLAVPLLIGGLAYQQVMLKPAGHGLTPTILPPVSTQQPAPVTSASPYSLTLRVGNEKIASGGTIYARKSPLLAERPTCEIKGPAGTQVTLEWLRDGSKAEQQVVTLQGNDEPTQVKCLANPESGKYVAMLRVNGAPVKSIPFAIETQRIGPPAGPRKE